MKDRVALLKNHFVENASNEEKMSILGLNTGNLVFWEALKRLFNPTIIGYKETDQLANFDKVIITDLIWIRENSNFDYLEKLVDTYNIPFIPISVGLQSPTMNPNFKLSESVVRLLKKIESRAVLGVRGYYTAEILKKYGITNFAVIGCPSMYYWNNPNLKINEAKLPQRASSNFVTFYSDLTRIEKHFLSYCADKNMQFIEQTSHKLTLEQTKDAKYFAYVKNWLDKKTECFYDYKSWSKGLKDIDFSFGGRFHGNVIALQNNIKSLFLISDSRTEEMTDLFGLPSLHISKFDRKKPLEYYFKLADYSKFNARYPLLYKRFAEFVSKNGLTFDKNATPLKFKAKQVNEVEKNVEPLKNIEPIDYNNNNVIYIKLQKEKNKIKYKFEVSGNWEKFFFLDHEFLVEMDSNVENCPDSIAIIPALATILPVSWVENATVIVDDIDQDFFECIENLKDQYREMINNVEFNGKLLAKKVTLNHINSIDHKVLCLYSGGVDATFTLLHNISYKPTILTIWGTDMFMDDIDAWNKVKKENQETANKFNLNLTTVKSSFRDFLNEAYLTQKYGCKVRDNWWHAYEHGLALLGTVAPYAYLNNFSDIKIASSFCSKDNQKVICASMPHIDENIRLFNSVIYHDGFYLSRIEKIKYIINYHKKYNKNFKLRVCWQEITSENCCVCEKCARTLFAIISLCEDPKDYGFNITEEVEKKLMQKIKNKELGNSVFWQNIKTMIKKNKDKLINNKLAMELLNN